MRGRAMKKIRLIRTQVIEFVPNPNYYPPGITIEQMAQIECDQEDQNGLFDGQTIIDETKYEIIDI